MEFSRTQMTEGSTYQLQAGHKDRQTCSQARMPKARQMHAALQAYKGWLGKRSRFQHDRRIRLPNKMLQGTVRPLQCHRGTMVHVLLTASIKPFKDGDLSIRASKTSSDSFRTYSSTE